MNEVLYVRYGGAGSTPDTNRAGVQAELSTVSEQHLPSLELHSKVRQTRDTFTDRMTLCPGRLGGFFASYTLVGRLSANGAFSACGQKELSRAAQT